MKSFQIDARNIDALYNSASIYFILNDKIEMCECLKN